MAHPGYSDVLHNQLTNLQLSDTLLSVLATRSGEMVESIFGKAVSQ